eukprot:COSAG02_NODE_12_length_58022_cov_242.077379_21_plen_146_part_00
MLPGSLRAARRCEGQPSRQRPDATDLSELLQRWHPSSATLPSSTNGTRGLESQSLVNSSIDAGSAASAVGPPARPSSRGGCACYGGILCRYARVCRARAPCLAAARCMRMRHGAVHGTRTGGTAVHAFADAYQSAQVVVAPVLSM